MNSDSFEEAARRRAEQRAAKPADKEKRAARIAAVREAARAFTCPKCGALEGVLCIGADGGARRSNHQERLSLSRPNRIWPKPPDPPALLQKIKEIDALPEQLVPVGMFVAYSISHPENGRIVYVGQSGRYKKRWKGHLSIIRRGRPRIKGTNIRTWIYDLIAQGLFPVFTILEICETEEASLLTETRWVEALTKRGESLLNGWKEHKAITRALPR